MADDFRTTQVGDRYAKALFDLAKDEGALAQVRRDLHTIKGWLADSAELRNLIASPVFSSEDKRAGLTALAQRAGLGASVQKFLGLLATNGRADALKAVIAAFDRLYAREMGIVSAEVVSATALSSAQLASIKGTLSRSLGREPELSTRVDPSILGGLRVRVGSRLFDASLKTRLDEMKHALKRA
ncbi:MAG: F0F1 ATP synthase subunit delta [Brevundimonas sp.]|uniref:F0F1 ATP synthase subunit delta n=1 Tax=Brevundimonas sp. TaxID=1871086 RepID=UPI00391B0387